MPEQTTEPSGRWPTPNRTERVDESPLVIELTTYYRGKTGGYVVERNHVFAIVDRLGRHRTPVWSSDWTQIAPGIDSRAENRVSRTIYGSRTHETAITGSLRVHRDSCPVYVRFDRIDEYNDYDDDSFSSRSSYSQWVRYDG